MVKTNKYLVYKKYKDEIWGLLVKNKKYSYTKKRLLLNYKDYIRKLKSRIRVKYKKFQLFTFNYYGLFSYKVSSKRLLFLSFLKRYFEFYYSKFIFSNSLKIYFKYLFFSNLFFSNKINFSFFKNAQKFKNTFLKLSFSLLKKFNKQVAFFNIFYFIHLNIYFSQLSLLAASKASIIKVNHLLLFTHNNNFSSVLTFYKNIYIFGRFRYLVRKRLQLQRRKEFFYCVHIAAPKKKKNKISLFGLKNMYYKKLSLFFGFLNVKKFFKLYDTIGKLRFDAARSFFLLLEGRLEIFLLRTNLFPSIYFIKKFILNGNVFVDNKKVISSDYILRPGSLVSFSNKYITLLYFNLKYFLLKKFIFLNFPRYMEFDYKLFCGMLIRKPYYKELTRPMSFDLYTSFLTFHR